MSRDGPGFVVAPWELRWRHTDPGSLGLTESAFALSNGHIGLRGTLDEGEPVVQPGTYLNGFYELRDLPYAERGYGYPESGQTVVNVTDGKIIRLLVEDEPMDLRYGTYGKTRADTRFPVRHTTPTHGLGLTDRAPGEDHFGAPGVVHETHHRRHQILGRAGR